VLATRVNSPIKLLLAFESRVMIAEAGESYYGKATGIES
jgi:hypothetical protein